MGDHGHVVGRDLHGGGAHAGGELPLGSGRDHLVAVGDQEPGRQRLPGRDAHHVPEGAPVQRLLDGEHDRGLVWVDVGREVVDEVVLGQPGKAVLVDVQMRQGRGRRSLLQQGTDRLALVESERGDVDQADGVGRIGAEGGDDLAAVGVPGNHGWPLLAGQDLAQSCQAPSRSALGATRCALRLPCPITPAHRSTSEFTYQTTTSTAERRSQPSCQPALRPRSSRLPTPPGVLGPGRPPEGRGESALEGSGGVVGKPRSSSAPAARPS